MFASAQASHYTGCYSFRASLARSLGFHVLKDSVVLGSDTGEPIILHVSLTPPIGTLQSTVLDWLSRIELASAGSICAFKAAGELEHLCEADGDGSLLPAASLPWSPLAAVSLLPAANHVATAPLSESAACSRRKLLDVKGDYTNDSVA
jgi:hypothetical protein